MITCQQCRDDLAEYDLGAADAARAEEVAAHLAACRACRQELDDVRAAWAAMPLALTPIEPSSGLFDKVASRLDDGEAAHSGMRPGRVERVLSYLVAAAVFIGLSVGLWQLGQPADDAAVRQTAEQFARRLGRLQEMERLLSADGVRLVSLNSDAAEGEVEGFILWDVTADQWHFYADRLPPPPDGQSYQIWVVGRNEQYKPGPVLSRTPDGLGSAVVDLHKLEVREAAKAVVTLEPSIGSKQPTGDVILEAAL
ncbi:MAG TPA: anti-sigma factor [Lacipirellula sp.]